MDFFAQQDRARRNTSLLVLLFIVSVISLVVLTNIAVLIFVMYLEAEHKETSFVFSWDLFTNLKLIASISAGVVGTVLVAVLFKWLSLSDGGKRVAESLGGERILPNTTHAGELRVLNVVEEMALASGMPVPPVYIIKFEGAINAFAAGNTPADAVIGVTRGCLNALDRDQLQGVIAHEFSHILNGDMRLNIRLIAVLHGIVFIRLMGEICLRSRSNTRSKDGQALVALGFALYIIGGLGHLCGQLIRATVSRQREFLADASAVQFTRNPEGIAGALKVIGGDQSGTQLSHEQSGSLSHLFFGQAVVSLFNTHPPLNDRILAVDPQWDGKYLPSQRPLTETPYEPRQHDYTTDEPSSAQTSGFSAVGWTALSNTQGLDECLMAGDIAGAQQTLTYLPDHLLAQAREPMGAMALVFGLVEQLQAIAPASTQDQDDASSVQLNDYRTKIASLLKDVPGLSQEINNLSSSLGELPRTLYVPLLELCFPALKCLSEAQYKTFKKQLVAAIRLDKKVDLYEWCLFQLITHYLDPEFGLAKLSKPKYKNITQINDAYCLVLSMLAHEGHDSDEDSQRAFTSCANMAGLPAAQIQALDDCKMSDFSKAVKELACCQPFLKSTVIRSFVMCTQHDGKITALEYEMLRSIAAVMDSPIPQLGVN